MKNAIFRPVLFAGLSTLLTAIAPVPVIAQERVTSASPIQAPGSVTAPARRVQGLRYRTQTPAPTVPGTRSAIARTSPAWMEKEIDVKIDNASVVDAIRQVLEAAKVDFDTVKPESVEIPGELKITLYVKKVRARDILAAVARIGGTAAFIQTIDGGKTTVLLRPRGASAEAPMILRDMPGVDGLFTRSGDMDLQIQAQVRDAMATSLQVANNANTILLRANSSALPTKRVKLDVKKSDPREILKQLCAQVDVSYAIDDDLPIGAERAFTFSDVPFPVALEMVCQSLGIGFRVEGGTKKGERPVIRLSKKYYNRLGDSRFHFTDDEMRPMMAPPFLPDLDPLVLPPADILPEFPIGIIEVETAGSFVAP